MRIVFADSGYWIAVSNPRDALHRLAVDARSRLGAHRIVTSELVLIEVLNCFSGDGPRMRRTAAGLVQRIIDNERIDLVLQTQELFHDALALYRERPDKDWSLTDCASFQIMAQRHMTEALTHDRHFEQYGYRALLRG
jgi:predicted nucleic acid-binding protein